jgi:hypothetical protein
MVPMRSIERPVLVTYEPASDMGYIHLNHIPAGGVERTMPLIVTTAAGKRYINLDFDPAGRLVGIEFDGARGGMPENLLDEGGR